MGAAQRGSKRRNPAFLDAAEGRVHAPLEILIKEMKTPAKTRDFETLSVFHVKKCVV